MTSPTTRVGRLPCHRTIELKMRPGRDMFLAHFTATSYNLPLSSINNVQVMLQTKIIITKIKGDITQKWDKVELCILGIFLHLESVKCSKYKINLTNYITENSGITI